MLVIIMCVLYILNSYISKCWYSVCESMFGMSIQGNLGPNYVCRFWIDAQGNVGPHYVCAYFELMYKEMLVLIRCVHVLN